MSEPTQRMAWKVSANCPTEEARYHSIDIIVLATTASEALGTAQVIIVNDKAGEVKSWDISPFNTPIFETP